MGFFLEGSRVNDFLLDTPGADEAKRRAGYVGDVGQISGAGVNRPASPTWNPSGGADPYDGGGYDVANGWRQMGTSAYDRDVDRYRSMAGQTQPAVQLDPRMTAGSRATQMGALGLLGNAAAGGAPSQAAILGRAHTEAAALAGANAAAAARGGPGAQIAAMRGAQMGAGQQALAAQSGALGMAGREMMGDMAKYAQGAQGARAGDIAVATKNAQLQAQQNALDAQHSQYYEQLGFDTRNTQQQAALDWTRQRQNEMASLKAAQLADDQAEFNKTMGFVAMGTGIGTGAMQGAIKSDVRAKIDMGSLGGLAFRRA